MFRSIRVSFQNRIPADKRAMKDPQGGGSALSRFALPVNESEVRKKGEQK